MNRRGALKTLGGPASLAEGRVGRPVRAQRPRRRRTGGQHGFADRRDGAGGRGFSRSGIRGVTGIPAGGGSSRLSRGLRGGSRRADRSPPLRTSGTSPERPSGGA